MPVPDAPADWQLTPRQREVWALMAEGWANPVIALRLVLGLKSVENYINAIYTALGIHDISYSRRVKAVLMYQEIANTREEAGQAAQAVQKAAILKAEAATLAETQRAEELSRKYLLALLSEALVFLSLSDSPAGLDGQRESLMGRILDALSMVRLKQRNN
jgi:DNA-binding CsgD family transcriptional regulator